MNIVVFNTVWFAQKQQHLDDKKILFFPQVTNEGCIRMQLQLEQDGAFLGAKTFSPAAAMLKVIPNLGCPDLLQSWTTELQKKDTGIFWNAK